MPDDYGPGVHVTVTVDPARNGGTPSLSRRMVPIPAVLGLLLAGEPVAAVRDEYDLTEAEGRVVEALAGVVRDLSAPAANLVAAVLGEMAAWARRLADDHNRGAVDFAGQDGVVAEQERLARAYTAAASLVGGLDPAALLHEWKCPDCGATTRARMADYPGGGR